MVTMWWFDIKELSFDRRSCGSLLFRSVGEP